MLVSWLNQDNRGVADSFLGADDMQTATPTIACEEIIMASTTFSGPVTSTNGFIGPVTGNVTGAVTATTISASGNATLSGTANVIIIPVADPHVVGAIWNNSGTLAVSAG